MTYQVIKITLSVKSENQKPDNILSIKVLFPDLPKGAPFPVPFRSGNETTHI